jgi:outer membrane protein insertion porin family
MGAKSRYLPAVLLIAGFVASVLIPSTGLVNDYLQFVPLSKWFTLMTNTELAYGKALGSTTSMPPYRNFFAGGAESVRGFRASTLGPKDTFGNPYGGNTKLTNQFELLLPMPEKFRNSARFSLFFDAGNVFSNDHVTFYNKTNVIPVEYKFDLADLKYSTGIAVQWLAPLGVFRFSYAVPLNAFKGNSVEYKDETEGFQFSIGQAF